MNKEALGLAPKSFGTAVSHILSCVPYGNSFGNFTIETPRLAANSFSAGRGGTGEKSKLWGKGVPVLWPSGCREPGRSTQGHRDFL